MGPAIHIPANLDREQLQGTRQRVEQLLTDLTLEAEDWAASGASRKGEVAVRRQARILRPHHDACQPPENSLAILSELKSRAA